LGKNRKSQKGKENDRGGVKKKGGESAYRKAGRKVAIPGSATASYALN